MKKIKALAIGIIIIASYNCKEVKKEAQEASEEVEQAVKEMKEVKVETIKFTMEPKSDSNVKGEVTFTEESGVVKMTANFSGLTPGEHAIHIHEKADCSAADGTSTGGHWNPTNQPHGKWGAAEGYHKGDIGNFLANADGTGTFEFATEEWCLGCGDPNKDLIGKGVIVHQGVDDFTTQPTGNAGGRISCTGIIQ
ncbi:MAG: superoxide dismutase family protein [Flavobacteriales bacterium]|nr:MAG: superoxide dismutase family protein [Flavobacteriales bacterium]